ncbi:GNAT family N-acetyltransferase [Flavobacterium sp.]|uniref:GNAT family N-acetyltransferase n=1 Tax=Flavobacterium sp. TaxID=239 RepID=UPI003D6C62AE
MEIQVFEIVKATLADLETLVAISRSTFYETFAKDNSEENMQLYLDEHVTLQKLTAEMNHQDSEFYLLKDGLDVIGYLKVNFETAQTELQDNHSLEIERIYVAAAFHGKHAGQLLFGKALEIARLHGLDYIWLGVWEENKKAIGFYNKNGFTAFDTHTFVVGNDAQTDILMKLPLK